MTSIRYSREASEYICDKSGEYNVRGLAKNVT